MRVAAALLAVTLVACNAASRPAANRLSEQERLWIWAHLESRQRRVEALADTPAGSEAAREVERYRADVRNRHDLAEADFAILTADAERLGWRESTACVRADGVVYGHALVLAPSPRRELVATYTAEACANGVEGVVLAGVVNARDGHVVSIEILKRLPDGLEERARAAIESVGWAPALLCGEPVTHYHIVKVTYRLPCLAAPGASDEIPQRPT